MYMPMEPWPQWYLGHFHHPRKVPSAPLKSIPYHTVPGISIWSDVYHYGLALPILELHTKGIIQYVVYHVWPLSLSMILRFIYILCLSVMCSVSLLSDIPLWKYHIMKISSVDPLTLMYFYVVLRFWLFRIMLLWTYMCNFIWEHTRATLFENIHVLSFHFGKYLWAELLGHIVNIHLTGKKLSHFFFPIVVSFAPISKVWGFQLLHISQLLSVFLLKLFLVGVKYCLTGFTFGVHWCMTVSNTFSCAIRHSYIFLFKVSIQSFLSIF